MADVGSIMSLWSATASSNSPADSTAVGSGLADNLRTIQAVVRTALAWYNSVAIASGGTTDLGANAGLFQEVSGTTTITALGSVSAGIWKVVRFQGALTLTHNATSLVLPTGANIVTTAGDYMLAFSKGSGNWVVPFYQKADGSALGFGVNNLTAETSPEGADLVGLYDNSASASRKMTLANMLKVVNDLSADATPNTAADYLLEYDASAGAAKKLLINTLFASLSEMTDGVTTSKAITPGGWAAGTTAASDGVISFPFGIILQWGSVAYTDPTESITFPTAFPTDLWSLTFSYVSGNAGHTGVRIISRDASGASITINPGSGGNATVYWMAIGH